ncbi:hypothetical protein ACHAPA_010527 [Fusarium lateritium]
MHISKQIITILAFTVLSVSAAPAEHKVAAKPGKMAAAASITYCANTRWNGECRTVGVPLDECRFKDNVPRGWNDRISSIRNNSKDTNICRWYKDWSCNGKSYGNQVDADLADGNGEFNDSISSYSCCTK